MTAMSGNHADDDRSTDTADALVRGLVESMSDSGEKTVPSPATDAEAVLRDQLVENTGRHLLDSGSHYGRAWEENRDNPPWEQPAWDVAGDYVSHNVYDFLSRNVSRDETAVAIETALYAFGRSGDRTRDSWLQTMEQFAEAMLQGEHRVTDLQDIGVPRPAAEIVMGVQSDVSSTRGSGFTHTTPEGPMTMNTYNQAEHTLSQCIQTVSLGGPYAEYVMVQIHGGCDIRGGYTAPRVYETYDGLHPMELEFQCTECDWIGYESCLYGTDELLFQRTVNRQRLQAELQDRADDEVRDDVLCDYAAEAADEAEADSHTDGGVFHVGDACGGLVRFH